MINTSRTKRVEWKVWNKKENKIQIEKRFFGSGKMLKAEEKTRAFVKM